MACRDDGTGTEAEGIVRTTRAAIVEPSEAASSSGSQSAPAGRGSLPGCSVPCKESRRRRRGTRCGPAVAAGSACRGCQASCSSRRTFAGRDGTGPSRGRHRHAAPDRGAISPALRGTTGMRAGRPRPGPPVVPSESANLERPLPVDAGVGKEDMGHARGRPRPRPVEHPRRVEGRPSISSSFRSPGERGPDVGADARD